MGQPIAAAPASGGAAHQAVASEQTPEQELMDDPRISHFTGDD
jgi:hypothetical protein